MLFKIQLNLDHKNIKWVKIEKMIRIIFLQISFDFIV